MAKSSGDILKLVELALDQFDQVPLATSCRRAVRIANLLGESQTALRFSYEVKFSGGSKEANAEDTRQLMVDPESWADEDGPAILALNAFMQDRKLDDGSGKIAVHNLDEIDYLLAVTELPEEFKLKLRGFRHTARGRISRAFARGSASWERPRSAKARSQPMNNV